MSERITRKNLETLLEHYCKIMGFKYGSKFEEITDGAYYLDCQSAYGGYRVERREGNSAASTPLGAKRHKAAALYDLLHFAIDSHMNMLKERQHIEDLSRVEELRLEIINTEHLYVSVMAVKSNSDLFSMLKNRFNLNYEQTRMLVEALIEK